MHALPMTLKRGDPVTVLWNGDAVTGAVDSMTNFHILVKGCRAIQSIYFEHEEGLYWVTGHHAAESNQILALAAAQALASKG